VPEPVDLPAVIVGAGPCGLAIARQLRHRHGIDALVVDRAAAPAAAWRARYDGFRLNTCGFWSHLPGQPIPRRYGRWPGRDEMVAYFDDYVRRQHLRPRLGVEITRIDAEGPRWRVRSADESWTASVVVVATGNYHTPDLPSWPGRDSYTGELVHSADYRNPAPYRGRDVVVVGSGNSATDIALQLHDGVASRVRMAVRTPPNLIPRSAAGIPIDAFSPVVSRLPVAAVDVAAAAVRRVWYGDLTPAGLPAPEDGIYRALLDAGQVPTLGDELVAAVKRGSIEVVSAVEAFDGDEVILRDGTRVRPDAVIAATGYRHGLEPMVGHLGVLDDAGSPVRNGPPPVAPGLWFAGYDEPLIGPLKSFRLQATPMADAIAGRLGELPQVPQKVR
jgi:cation diffusion facilitator CzcD-associated flavoprotein CzcO